MSKCSAVLEPSSVQFPPTYITSESKFTIRIKNNQNKLIHCSWRKFSTEEEENNALKSFDMDNAEERKKCTKSIYYNSPIFKLKNNVFSIWPKRFEQIIVSFNPQESVKESDTAYLYIEETKERIPCQFQGKGLPPEACFSVSSVNVGHVALDSILEYEISLSNIGKVACDFQLLPKDTGKLKFEFTPSSGHLNIGENVPIHVKFYASQVGSFSESFEFNIKGSNSNFPSVVFYGKVTGPTFEVSTKYIIFGDVSYGFLYEKSFDIVNLSDIEFDFSIELSYDGSFSRREFSISPQLGTIKKSSKQTVKIEFIPMTTQKYELTLFINIAKYGDHMVKIPIVAECCSPSVYIPQREVDFGEIFIGAPYTGKIDIVDKTNLPAKFEFVQPSELSLLHADIEVIQPNGVVPPNGTISMPFTIISKDLGPLEIVHHVRIFGNDEPPIPFVIKAVSNGPKINFSSNKINFTKVNVLTKTMQQLIVSNDSIIPASFTAFIEGKGDVFQVNKKEGVIAPHSQEYFDIIAFLDDIITFKGRLVFAFQYLNPIYIELTATGVGSTITSSIPLTELDYGNIFSESPNVKTFELKNEGRRPQELRFSVQKPKLSRTEGVKFSCKITPDSIELAPGESATFSLSVLCNKTISFNDYVQCSSTISRQRTEAFTLNVKGTFVKPFISFSKQSIVFKHVHDASKEEMETGSIVSAKPIHPPANLLGLITSDLVIKNNSKLCLTCFCECPSPFSIAADNSFTLEPHADKKITITFDPSIKEDYSCETITKNLVISYKEHPQRNTISLVGSFVFPNITFSPNDKIDFGTLMTNTERSNVITMKNPTELPADFVWELLPGENGLDISNIFDIYPIRGHIDPQSTDTVHVSFFAQNAPDGSNTVFEGSALCHVIGGPDYIIKLTGGSANIQFKIDQYQINLGYLNYLSNVTSTVTLQNLSEVPLQFSVRIPKNTTFQVLLVSPNEGTVAVKSTQKFSISVTGGIPKNFDEPFFIKVGFFDEVRIDIKAKCYMPQLKLTIPHDEDCPVVNQYSANRQREKELRDRKKLIEFSKKKAQEEEEDVSDTIYEPTESECLELERNMLITKLSQKKVFESSLRRRRQKKDSLSSQAYTGYVASKYLIDVGKIVFGRAEKFSFKLISNSPAPFSFDILDYELKGSGFTIEQTSFTDVKPGEEITVELKFNISDRTTDVLGDTSFQIPIKFSSDFAYIVRLHCILEMPVLRLSQKAFNFGTTIVGQSYIMTLQLQNMNYVPIEYKFAEQKPQKNQSVSVFTASPLSGVLPPSSFQNIEITFLPELEKSYSMQLPIFIKHNTQPTIVSLSGVGVQLTVTFDPPELLMPPILPFSEPSTVRVNLFNPTQWPVDVLATQFDLQLLLEDLEQKKMLTSPSVSSSRSPDVSVQSELERSLPSPSKTPTVSNVSKFSLCVIVHGAQASGKTTTSTLLANSLGGVPVISLKEIWADVIKNPQAQQSDYIRKITETIEQPEYADGFVVDGLDGLPDNAETDAFITHCIKTKNIWDEIAKNPWNVYQHTNLTSFEQALSYVLASLDGHYVFLVALKADEAVINKREEKKLSIEKKKKRHEAHVEKEMLFKMSEEEYQQLSPEEQKNIDKKRDSYRKKSLKQIIDTTIEETKQHESSKKRSSSSSSKSKSKTSKEKAPAPKEKQSDKKPSKQEEVKKEIKTLKSCPTDPLQKSICLFSFTLGSVFQKVKEGNEQFTAIDPNGFTKEKLSEPTLEKNELNASKQSFSSPLQSKSKLGKSQQLIIPSVPYQKNFNSILIDTNDTPETIAEYAGNFVPKVTQMKEKAFTRLIPLPRIIMPDPSSFMKATLLTIPKYFSIVVDEPFTQESITARQQQMRPDSNTKSGRKSKAKKDRSQELVIGNDIDLSKRTPRWKIDPNSSQALTIQFNATLVGNYKDNIIFSIINGRSEIMKLPVSGQVAYPDITRDVKFIFPKRQLRIDSKSENSFITSTQEFYFGSILVEEKVPKVSQYKYKSTINIENPSLFPAECVAVFADNTQKQLWNIENPSFTIKPGERQTLTFGIHPTSTETYRNILQLFVKDNPEPLMFNVSAECCAPSIKVNDTTLDFEKLLLGQEKQLYFEIKNDGMIPAAWRLKNLSNLGTNFEINQTEGILKPRGTFKVCLTFSSTKPVIIKKPISIEVLDKDKIRTFSSKQILVSAEAFDVNIELQYPKGVDHLQYGIMKVGQQKMIPLTLKNKGKYPTMFRVSIKGKKNVECFNVQPMEDVIPGSDKAATINFTFSSTKLVSFNDAKGISIDIIDTLTNTTTQTIPLLFSAQTMYSQFQIEPKTELSFGSLPVETNLIKQIVIENQGTFPFEYKIIQKPEPIEQSSVDLSKSKKKKGALTKPPSKPITLKSPLLKKGKKGEKSVCTDNFVIVPSQAIVQPGTKANIDIDFISQFTGKYTTTLLIQVSDADPQTYPGPIEFNLLAESFVPGVSITDFEKIFVGTHLCLRHDIIKSPSVAFLEDDQVLFFSAHMIGTKTEIPMTLTNPLPIACTVDCTLKPNAKGKAALANFPFDVSEKVVQIQPNSSKIVNITFIPNSADRFYGTFEAIVRGSTEKNLKFGLEGIGTMPIVSILTQLEKANKNGVIGVNIGRTLVGFTKQKVICLANDGLIDAKLIVSAKKTLDFELYGIEPDTETLLSPGQRVNLTIVYMPQKARKGQFDLSFSVVDNPKASTSLSIIGEGFLEDLIFEGLQDDDLYFTDNVVGRQQQQTFALRNVCQNDIKFQWQSHPEFTFSPSVGHVRVGQSKQVTVTFITDKVVKYMNLKVALQWQKIRFTNERVPDWDDTQKIIKFTSRGLLKPNDDIVLPRASLADKKLKKPLIKRPNTTASSVFDDDKEMVKVVEIRPEPPNMVLPIKTKDLVLKISAISDFIKYSIDTTEIAFSPTMMYEKRIVAARMVNTSQIRFDYNWRVENFRSLRTNYAETREPAFSISPSSGYIEAGQSTTFYIAFEPQEVDDFTAFLRCEIPFLSQMPAPTIYVSGFSRRPLCHFNVVLSDYISAGRRHPDYTDPLPEGIRVIELFSNGIGKVAKKRFEVINPTSSSYEINWKPASNAKSSITCDSPAALVSSGKRYSVSFSYLPTSVKTVESQWIFQIPEHQVSVPFLFVGRILPH